MPPRDVLIRNAVGFIRASSRCPMRLRVSGESGHVNGNRISLSKEPVQADGFRSVAGDQRGLEIRIVHQHFHS